MRVSQLCAAVASRGTAAGPSFTSVPCSHLGVEVSRRQRLLRGYESCTDFMAPMLFSLSAKRGSGGGYVGGEDC